MLATTLAPSSPAPTQAATYDELGGGVAWSPSARPGADWEPPSEFASRAATTLTVRPAHGHVILFALLSDELFGPGPSGDVESPSMKRAEMVIAYVVNVGASPWSGTVRLEIPEAGVRHDTVIKRLDPNEIGVGRWVSHLRAPDGDVTVTASVLEGGRVVDRMTKTSSYYRDWPTTFPVGLFVRDLGAPSTWPAWLPGRPYAVSFLTTAPVGNNHIVACDDAGCEDTYGIFFTGAFRVANLAGFGSGETCFTTHVDYWGTGVWPHDGVDDRECLPR